MISLWTLNSHSKALHSNSYIFSVGVSQVGIQIILKDDTLLPSFGGN